MNIQSRFNTTLAAAVAAILLAACSSALTKPDGAENVRSKLTRLQADPQLSSRAPVAIKDAELAVRAAEQPRAEQDAAVGKHLVLIADRKVDIASAQAQARWLEDQRKSLNDQQQAARLDARTREAERARGDANAARNDAALARRDESSARVDAEAARRDENLARVDATVARRDEDSARADAGIARADAENARLQADVARIDTATAERQSESLQRTAKLEADELKRQIAELNGKTTERGLVVTLGDVLFSTGQSDLKGGAQNNLAKLAAFLNKYPDSSAMIEGHTDNVGNDDMNQSLSQRRADSVKSYLMSQGVGFARLSATGKGEGTPISGNDSATGRQQNRRVEVIIANPRVAAAAISSPRVVADGQ
jgi:outer membrane protein OmpA-like peptidoglycan-associated protein